MWLDLKKDMVRRDQTQWDKVRPEFKYDLQNVVLHYLTSFFFRSVQNLHLFYRVGSLQQGPKLHHNCFLYNHLGNNHFHMSFIIILSQRLRLMPKTLHFHLPTISDRISNTFLKKNLSILDLRTTLNLLPNLVII